MQKQKVRVEINFIYDPEGMVTIELRGGNNPSFYLHIDDMKILSKKLASLLSAYSDDATATIARELLKQIEDEEKAP